MRRILLSLAILAYAAPLRAGVYNLDAPGSIYPSDYVQASTRNPTAALMYLSELRAINDLAPNAKQPAAGSLREGYARQAEALEAKQRDGSLSLEDRINLGACLIRMGRIPQATAVLEEAQRVAPADAPSRFFLLANLANAYQENDDLLQRAIDTQNQALKLWPEQWSGWRPGEGLWYRRAETYTLKLMMLRNAELRHAVGRPGGFQTLDVLFPHVRFVGPSGRYEAGHMDFAQWNELPLDAESIVLQLLFWRPLDNRLYWQYGELLNARGQVDVASRILDELVRAQQMRQAELQEHNRVLKAAIQSSGEVRNPLQDWGLWVGGPREQKNPPPATASAGNWLPDWRHITVSFVTGMVVAVLGVLQWQQWRRSRRADTPARATSEPEAPSAGEVAGPSRYSRPVDG